MRNWLFVGILLAAPGSAAYANEPNPMSAGDYSCTSYLAVADDSGEKGNLNAWAAGRVAAIVPATFQPTLRNISMVQFQQDLHQLCTEAGSALDLFAASAILAYRYQQRPGS